MNLMKVGKHRFLDSLGFCLLVGHGLNNCWMSVRRLSSRYVNALRALLTISTVVVTSGLLAKTLCRNQEWSSRTTLFT